MTAPERGRTVDLDDDDHALPGRRQPGVAPSEGRGHMGLYVIERTFLEGLDPDALDEDEIKLVNDDVGVKWILSFLSADKRRTYCLYEAPNPESLREAAARLGIPADAVIAVEGFGPMAEQFPSSSTT
jgi:hypothetical protein